MTNSKHLLPKAASLEELMDRVRLGYGTTSQHLRDRHFDAWRQLLRRGLTEDQILAAL